MDQARRADLRPRRRPLAHRRGSSHPGGFNAAFADGSVRFFKDTLDLKVFRDLVTATGGEFITLRR